MFNTFFEMLCFVACFNAKSRVSILHSVQHHCWKSAVQTLLNWIFEIERRARSRPAYRGSGPLLLLRFNVRRSPDSFSKSSPNPKSCKTESWRSEVKWDFCSCLFHSSNRFPCPVMWKTHVAKVPDCWIVHASDVSVRSVGKLENLMPIALWSNTSEAVHTWWKESPLKNPRLCFDVLESRFTLELHMGVAHETRTPWCRLIATLKNTASLQPWAPRLGRTIVSI